MADNNPTVQRTTLLQIGEVAERAGLSLRTVRYYEEIGLVVPSARTEGGFRLYAEADLKRLLLIKPMKPLGFTLDEMREFADLLAQQLEPHTSDPEESARGFERLRAFAEQTDKGISKLETSLRESHELRAKLEQVLAHRQVILELQGDLPASTPDENVVPLRPK